MYIVKNFVYFSSKPLANMLFKSFIMSLISYYFIFTCIYASDKKAIRKIFKDCFNLGIEYHDITETLAIKYIEDDDHFVNEFFSQCPSGSYRTVKYRGA